MIYYDPNSRNNVKERQLSSVLFIKLHPRGPLLASLCLGSSLSQEDKKKIRLSSWEASAGL